MKRYSSILLFMISLALITSCGSDDDNGPTVSTGSFSIDNDTFDVSQGFFSPTFEDQPGLFYKTIIISDDGFVFNSNGRAISGTSNAVIIDLYSTVDDNNLFSDYTITDGSTVAGQATAYYAINYDIDNDTVDDEEDIESGNLSITRNNDGAYSLILSNGQVDITGQMFSVDYDGTIKIINF